MDYPMTQGQAEDWCKRHGAAMSFYEEQGPTHMMHFVELRRDDMFFRLEYTPSDHGVQETAIGCAVREIDGMIRAKDPVYSRLWAGRD
jgi:hypothetical protein